MLRFIPGWLYLMNPKISLVSEKFQFIFGYYIIYHFQLFNVSLSYNLNIYTKSTHYFQYKFIHFSVFHMILSLLKHFLLIYCLNLFKNFSMLHLILTFWNKFSTTCVLQISYYENLRLQAFSPNCLLTNVCHLFLLYF